MKTLSHASKAVDRMRVKISVPTKAVSTFIGVGGQSLRKLRRLCVGCELDMTQVADGNSEVAVFGEDEEKLGIAVGLVKKWVAEQQVRCPFWELRCG